MDYSKFLDDSFEAKDWINASFRSNKDSGLSNDQYATTLVMKLQLLVQEVNNVIEETSQEVVSNLPRVLRNVEAIKQEATLLQDQMKHIKQDVQKVEQDTSASMQTLLQLDTIKSRMEQTSEALQQADNWTVLSSEVEDVIQSGDAELLNTKLVAMQQSLLLLANVPDYDDRCQHLEALKNRLETLVSPSVINSLTNNSQDSTRHYVKMFESIHRLPQMYRYYKHFHKSSLGKSWTELTDMGEKTLPQSLSLFYDIIISTLHSQISWCNGVFDDPLQVVCEMITVSLQSIEKDISASFSQHLESQDNVLSAVTQLKQVTDTFAQAIETILLNQLAASEVKVHYAVELAQVIYSPYLPYIQEYRKLETHYINQQLDAIELEDRKFIDTSINKLSSSVSHVFKVAQLVDERCRILTGGGGYLHIAEIYKQYFTSYSSEVKRILVNFGEKFKSQPDDQLEVDSWAMFSYSLQIIKIIGEIITEIEELDQSIVGNILLSTDQLQLAACSPLSDMRVTLVTPAGQVQQLEQLRETVSEKQTILTVSLKVLRSLSEHAHKLAFDSVFSQIATHLHVLSESQVWMSKSAGGALTADLPTFSLSPQEYITQIGQYIMTLPQYLDPFTSDAGADDSPEASTTNLALSVAVKYGRLPYTKLQDREGEQLDNVWLESISRATMYTYCEEILRIPEISTHATKQLITDIDYLVNVLDDLGLAPTDQLMSVTELLKVSPDEYIKASLNIPKTISSAIQVMRNIET